MLVKTCDRRKPRGIRRLCEEVFPCARGCFEAMKDDKRPSFGFPLCAWVLCVQAGGSRHGSGFSPVRVGALPMPMRRRRSAPVFPCARGCFGEKSLR